jgi:hypothetical protein
VEIARRLWYIVHIPRGVLYFVARAVLRGMRGREPAPQPDSGPKCGLKPGKSPQQEVQNENEDTVCLHGQYVQKPDGGGHFPP